MIRRVEYYAELPPLQDSPCGKLRGVTTTPGFPAWNTTRRYHHSRSRSGFPLKKCLKHVVFIARKKRFTIKIFSSPPWKYFCLTDFTPIIKKIYTTHSLQFIIRQLSRRCSCSADFFACPGWWTPPALSGYRLVCKHQMVLYILYIYIYIYIYI